MPYELEETVTAMGRPCKQNIKRLASEYLGVTVAAEAKCVRKLAPAAMDMRS